SSMRLSSRLLFSWTLSGNDKCNHAFIERAMVRVLQFNEHLVLTGGKTHQDNWLTTRICPHPRGIVDSDLHMRHPGRDSQSIWPEHRHTVPVMSTILNNRHPTRGERFGERRKGDNLRWRLFDGERDEGSGSAAAFFALRESGHRAHPD